MKKLLTIAIAALSYVSPVACVTGNVGYFLSWHIDRMLLGKCNGTTLTRLAAVTPGDYRPQPVDNAWFAKSDPGPPHQQWMSDSEQSFRQAVMYACTRRTVYADNAAAILRAWPRSNRAFDGPNALLAAGWGTAGMARASALLLRTQAPGWTAADNKAYLQWVDAKLGILWNGKFAESWDRDRKVLSNWHITVIEARLNVALLRGDAKGVEWAVRAFKNYATYGVTKDGLLNMDSSRDLQHSMFALGGLLQTAETLYLKGHDLYDFPDGRIQRALEQHGRVAATQQGASGISAEGSNWVLPTGWHLGLRHYVGRKKRAMPWTTRAYARVKPVYVFHWGLSDIYAGPG